MMEMRAQSETKNLLYAIHPQGFKKTDSL